MTEKPTKPRGRRTFSAFGDVRRMPSEYEVVTQAQNWTLRRGRNAAFEQNPSSAPNLWFLTYREGSPFRAEDWDAFRSPDKMTYRMYVNTQADAEQKVHGILEQFAAVRADATLAPGWLNTLAHLYTPARYPLHGFQQIEAYVGYMAPTSYITNAAALSTADFLRRVTTLAYRTRELQLNRPESRIGTDQEHAVWMGHEAWQPLRRAVETLLATYDWGEAFVALNLVVLPTVEEVLGRQLGEAARRNGDDVSWLLEGLLSDDARRRDAWSIALMRMAVAQRPPTSAVVERWVSKWSPIADEAAAGLATLLATLPEQASDAPGVLARAIAARESVLGAALDAAGAEGAG